MQSRTTVMAETAAVPATDSLHQNFNTAHRGTEFIQHVMEESIRLWYAHAKARATLLKGRLAPSSAMARVLQQLRLHQQAEREGVHRELLG